MMTLNCRICNNPKEDVRANECNGCKTVRVEAEQHHAAENPKASEGEILYAGRAALNQRAHHAHRNFVDPRDFTVGRGSVPEPPQRADA